MANPADVNVIDGYTSVQAVRHSVGRGRSFAAPAPEHPQPPEERPEPAASDARQADGLRIGHTIVPLRRNLACYGCGYRFLLTGRFQKTYCPKCRQELDLTDHVIEDEFTGTMKTLGRVEIRPGAVLNGALVIAGDLVLLGDASAGRIEVCGTLELCLGSRFDLDNLKAPTIVIARGSRIKSDSAIRCENLEVEGELNASVYSTGTVTVHCGGMFAGELHGAHLTVVEGAALAARISVRPGTSAGAARAAVFGPDERDDSR